MRVLAHRALPACRLLVSLLLVAVSLAFLTPSSAQAAVPGGEFDDGNLAHDSEFDWNDLAPTTWTGAAPYRMSQKSFDGWQFTGIEDAEEVTSDTAFAGGTKQDDDCAAVNGQKAPNKDDLRRIYLTNKTVGGDVILGLSWTRIPQNTTSPSAHIGFEFNQGTEPCGAGSGGLVKRTEGDMLVVYDFEGGATDNPTITLRRWVTSGACEIGNSTAPCWGPAQDLTASGVAEAKVNTFGSVIDDIGPGGTGVSVNTNEFGEAGINLTDAGVFDDEECTNFGTVYAVSRSSGNSGNAQMKDLVGPGDFEISNCGALRIEKRDDQGALLPGATFTIEPSPIDDADSLTVTDGGANDPDGEANGVIEFTDVDPGTYEVTEVTAPTGYQVDDSELPKSATVEVDETATIVVTNNPKPGKIIVEKTDKKTGEALDGAWFQLWRDDGDGSFDPATEGGGDTKVGTEELAGGGTLSWVDLEWGDYWVEETEAPPGYQIDPNSPYLATVDATHLEVTVGVEDPRKPGKITVEKYDATGSEPLDGAMFQLWLDEDDNGEVDPEVDTPVGPEVTTDGGSYTWTGLAWGDYLVEETEAPAGYEIDPDSPFDATVGPGSLAVTVQMYDPRIPGEISLTKLDATSEELVDASFQLWRDDGDGVFETDEDTMVGGEITTTGGAYTWGDLEWADYWIDETGAPTGYDEVAPVLVSVGPESVEVGVTIRDPRLPGEIDLTKIDGTSQEALDGATFQLWLDDGDGTFEDDQDTAIGGEVVAAGGTYVWNGLEWGDYWVEETEAPTGYEVDPNSPYLVTVGAETLTVPVEVVDPRLPGEISLTKIDETSQDLLDGAKFQLWLDDGDGVFESDADTLVGDEVTANGGTYTWSDVEWGDYWVEETKAPTGYEVDPSSPYLVSVGAESLQVSVDVVDPRIPGTIKVKKYDAVSEEMLDGAMFQLWLDDGDGVLDPGTDTAIGDEVTAAGGSYTWDDLDWGDYLVEETKAPTGYDIDPDSPYLVSVGAESLDVKVNVLDPRLPGEIVLTKVDEETGDLVDATFQLWLDDGDGELDPTSDTAIGGEVTTTEGGYTWSDLEWGDYFVEETDAPTGYDISPDSPVLVTIGAESLSVALTVVDPRLPGTIELTKVDADTGDLLDGATFQLWLDDGDGELDAEADTKVGSPVVAAGGLYTWTGLAWGDYFVEETAAPAGYELSEESPVLVSVTKDGLLVELTVENAPIPPEPGGDFPPLPDAGGPLFWLVGLGLVLALAGGGALYLRRRETA